tara:strand:+ start:2932 stop:3267 length:336 start_codon:yes stop_codon:yes gene_type:complete
MTLDIRILGMQPEPSLVEDDLEMYDISYRTRDPETFEKGKALVNEYISNLGFKLKKRELSIIDDPMQISIGDCENGRDTGRFSLNNLALQLEKLGFFGKGANYRKVNKNAN